MCKICIGALLLVLSLSNFCVALILPAVDRRTAISWLIGGSAVCSKGSNSNAYEAKAVESVNASIASTNTATATAMGASLFAGGGAIAASFQREAILHRDDEIQRLEREMAIMKQKEKHQDLSDAPLKAKEAAPIPTSSKAETKGNHAKNARVESRVESPEYTVTSTAIGRVSSVFKLCVGTPRQGMLAPTSRGRIDLNPKLLNRDTVLGLEQYSHVWIVFAFHLNTKDGVSPNQTRRNYASKISPPALHGAKVGVFSTRSPHRPNPIGFTLARLERVEIPNRTKQGRFCLHLCGLDLVDGTPVLDIKPYVPHYDSVGYKDVSPASSLPISDEVRIPKWVRTGLAKRRPVAFSHTAEEQLQELVRMGRLQFYNQKSFVDRTTDGCETMNLARKCIIDVLSVDVRSAWQKKKLLDGSSRAESVIRDSIVSPTATDIAKPVTIPDKVTTPEEFVCNDIGAPAVSTQQIDNVLVYFSVGNTPSTNSNSSIFYDVDETEGTEFVEVLKIQEITWNDAK